MCDLDTERLTLLRGLAADTKYIPCSYLYDEQGSALYNKITELEEYYPYRTEISMLEQHAEEMIAHIPPHAVVVELGCGSATKTAILQRCLLKRDGPKACTFVGIDVSSDFLDQAKANMLGACPGLLPENVEMIQATYLQGLVEARKRHPDEVLCVLWLGSSIGNLSQEESLQFFKDTLTTCGPNTQMLVCTDLWKDRSMLHRAYCDSKGVTEAFIKNGAKHAMLAASNGSVSINAEKWDYDVVVNPDKTQVEMYLVAGESLTLSKDCQIAKGERILMEVSRKFRPEQLRELAFQAGFLCQACWHSTVYGIQIICAPKLAFELTWKNTDHIFQYVPDWSAVPISLRHPFCFYYAHVAAFAKLKLLQDEKETSWDRMFSRGIDPDVQNPKLCHSHPDVPTAWPPLKDILSYTHKARKLVQERVSRDGFDLFLAAMALEHECMHQETLCYMLAQQQKQHWEHLAEGGHLIVPGGAACRQPLTQVSTTPTVRAGPCSGKKIGGAGQRTSHTNGHQSGAVCHDDWVEVPAGEVVLGVQADPQTSFHWDNEGPPQAPQKVGAFKVAASPVTIRQFRDFVLSKGYQNSELWTGDSYKCLAGKQKAPATWTVTADGEVWIHFPEGTCHWESVSERPVWCSLAEAQAFCFAKGVRVMSELEYLRAQEFDSAGERISDLGCNGWELTSSPMKELHGFKALVDYPEYSADFYDGKHFVLRGASPYTPALVTRPAFRNFYQNAYPYQFAKFRCCSSQP